MQERITQLLTSSASWQQQALDDLSESLIVAAQWMAQSLLQENKIMCFGAGPSNSLSQYFCYSMLNRLERERPALPAINLCSESALSALTESPDRSDIFSNQIQALGQANDTLLVIANNEQTVAIHQAIHTAEQRQIKVVLLNCNQERWWDEVKIPDRLELFSETQSAGLTQQLHLVATQALCELIEIQLFGE
ncbi:MAG: SIS domain-containing protein [Pseudomonadales bacterium]|nr:SIS domain-containing protein [Pseudomonadales bacterium]